MKQGDIARTENATDMAINGDGFFQVMTPTGIAYTRDGSMHFDKDGHLVNKDGHKVQGFLADESGNITTRIGEIQVNKQSLNAMDTKEIKMSMNLDSRAEVMKFDIDNPEYTSNYSHAVTVYDNVGTQRVITIYYNKTSDNNWKYRAVVDGSDAANNEPPLLVSSDEKVVMAEGDLIFNNKGILQEEKEVFSSFNFNKGAAPNQKITFDFGKSILEGGNGIGSSTQFGSDTNIGRHSADGRSAGSLSSFSFDDEGILTIIYDNGESEKLAQIGVAKFENNEGLHKLGKNLYGETVKSGAVIMGKPNTMGRGEIITKSLELSNVDIADQFVDLITTQRNFQANTKSLQTADQMLSEVLSIKR